MSARSAASWKQTNDPVIAEFRANHGVVKRRHWPVILLTTTGALTGRPRVTPLNFSLDGERIVVIASNGGAATNPAWFRNLVANPKVSIEFGDQTFRARARVAEEPERTRLFDQQARQMRFFDGYRKRVKARKIPVVVFERLDAAG